MANSSRLKSNAAKCKECGWQCQNCTDQTSLHLHVEIENLKQRLLEREHHIVNMETNFLNEAEKFPNGEFSALTEELLTWQEKYSRLYESHKRVQKVNQNLEDKLLRIVDKCETEKNTLTQDLGSVTQQLVEAKSKVKQLEDENDRYRNDVNLAIQLLQCKPTNFVSQKLDTMSPDLQLKVRAYLSNKRPDGSGSGSGTPKPEPKIIKVPIPTFPPTAMVYSLNTNDKEDSSDGRTGTYKQPVDIVSAAIMAKVLEERARERLSTKHCPTCTCTSSQQSTDNTAQATSCHTDAVTFTNNIANSSNRGSQGLVRYIDVVTTRSKNEPVKSSQNLERGESRFLGNSKSCESPMSHTSLKNLRYISSPSVARTSVHADIRSNARSADSMKLTDVKPDPEDSRLTDGKESSNLSKPTDSGKALDLGNLLTSVKGTDVSKPLSGRMNLQAQDDILWSNLSNSNSASPSSSQVSVDIESVASEQPLSLSSVTKSREALFGIISDNKRLQSYFDKNEPIRIRSEEGRTFLGDKNNMKTIEISKYTNSNRPIQGKTDLMDGRRSKTTGRRLGSNSTEVTGPRACSLRIQAGTSNILLANATCYTPVLYTSRSDVMVHLPRSRSTSASSNET